MSTTPLFRLSRPLRSALLAVMVTASCGVAATAAEPLWDATLPHGQWRAFGTGVLDTRTLENPAGLSIQVDWDKATFGTGLAYESQEGGAAFPTLPTSGRISFEARIQSNHESNPATELRAEWIARNADTIERTLPLKLKATEAKDDQWTRFEFTFGPDTPGYSQRQGEWNALRIVFPKRDQTGTGRVELRNVELHTEPE